MLETLMVDHRRILLAAAIVAGGVIGAAVTMVAIDRTATIQVMPIPSIQVLEIQRGVPATAAPTTPATPDRMCLPDEPGTPVERWTMSENHFGPFHPCETMTLDFVKQAMPGHDIKRVRPAMAGGGEPDEHDQIVVSKAGRMVVSLWPAEPGRELEVIVHDRRAQTPWRVRVGDTLETLLAHHRKIHCVYGASEWGELYHCRRIHEFPADGWVDTFQYQFDLAPFGPYERDGKFLPRPDWLTAERDAPAPQAKSLKIEAIAWKPTPTM